MVIPILVVWALFYLHKTKNIPLRYVSLTKPHADSYTSYLQSLAVNEELLATIIIKHIQLFVKQFLKFFKNIVYRISSET